MKKNNQTLDQSKASITLIILSLVVLLNSCSGQTKKVENENELSILMFNDTISYYNGILTKDTKISTIPYDTNTIKELIQKNKDVYKDRLRIFIKMSDKIRFIDPVVKLVEIAKRQEVFATGFPLTKADRSYFKVEEFSWEPPAPVEIADPTSVTTKSIQEFPAIMVELRNDNSVWYKIMVNNDDTVMKKVDRPVKENLKKVIAGYNEMIAKENKKGNYVIKGDKSIKYPDFKEVLAAFKENNVFKFKMITTDEPLETVSENPGTLNLFMPKDEPAEVQTKANSFALTLLLLKNNILAYNGDKMFDAETYDYKTIHKLLMTQSKKYGKDFVVIIKPAEEAPYKATVDILDEMAICDIKRYAMVNLKPVEKEIIKKFNSSIER